MQININDYHVKEESLIVIPKFGVAKYKFSDVEFIEPVQVVVECINRDQPFIETFNSVEIRCHSNTIDIVRESGRIETFSVNDVTTLKIKEIEK